MRKDEGFELPDGLIAAVPAEPRDSSRLFVYEAASGMIRFGRFADLSAYLPADSLLVLNDTKVVPARLKLNKRTGGKIEMLLLLNEWPGGSSPIAALSDRKAAVGDVLSIGDDPGTPMGAGSTGAPAGYEKRGFEVVGQDKNVFYLKPLFNPASIHETLLKHGSTPVPKYIKGMRLGEAELRQRYQAIFAANPSSVAAPTASLHFTEGVFKSLEERGIQTARISLHVGLGTFAPVTEEDMRKGELHKERYSIPAGALRAIQDAKAQSRPVVAVGTTTVRALESAALRGVLSGARKATATAASASLDGETNIFIKPPFDFKAVDILITNFHLPGSSLMMLVQAFLEYKGSPKRLAELYEIAIAERFRFYSFGDAMLIL
ncbi:MAG: tRNA preQ1(34) S-adenosylmethionine ribosyltransferase-isomerase QueA [Patescibacteria group bacterium]|nr:tRNA preQ1(34) S-adenosylmethionine ribosyltransferase-isomerase QueA [Patescibacteria group bacterium]